MSVAKGKKAHLSRGKHRAGENAAEKKMQSKRQNPSITGVLCLLDPSKVEAMGGKQPEEGLGARECLTGYSTPQRQTVEQVRGIRFHVTPGEDKSMETITGTH
uniref:Uncharacterized protein n=1 Tax=Cricetulus griseus TaxID=10029 RepID=A0A8C2MX87_CRIGR